MSIIVNKIIDMGDYLTTHIIVCVAVLVLIGILKYEVNKRAYGTNWYRNMP